MATIKNGILGGFSGRVGNVVGATVRGRNVMRVRPASVTNPNTEKQRSQRERFGLVTHFLSSQIELVKIGFRSFTNKLSAFNAATSYNLKNAVIGNYPDVQLSFADAKISKGNLPPVAGLVATFVAPDTISLEWTDNSSKPLAAATDLLMIGLYEPTKGIGFSIMNAATRADGQVTVEMPEECAGLSVEVYAFYLSLSGLGGAASKDQISDSVHGGSILLST